MRTSFNGVDLIKNCPKCDSLIKIAEKTCSFCGYAWLPTVLTEEEAAWTYDQTVEMINDAFFRIETYGQGNTSRYASFDFWRMFSVLFEKTREPQNQKLKNFNLIQKYSELIHQLATDWDKGRFENEETYKNESFISELDTINYIVRDRWWEFLEFEIPNKKDRLSITDMMKNDEDQVFEEFKDRETSPNHMQPLNYHFDKIRECQMSQLETLIFAEKYTNNFDLERLKLLKSDFDFYLFVAKDEKEAEYSEEDIDKEIQRLKNAGREVPIRQLLGLRKKGEPADPNKKPNFYIDLEAMFYSAEFFCCYQFKNLLKSKIQEAENKYKSEAEIKAEHRADAIIQKLKEFGFLELSTIQNLQTSQRMEIRSHISKNNIPFSIALLNQLGLPEHLEKTQTKTKAGVHKLLATLLDCPERTIKGNLNSLNPLSKEDRKRYTAHLHIEEAKRIIQEIIK